MAHASAAHARNLDLSMPALLVVPGGMDAADLARAVGKLFWHPSRIVLLAVQPEPDVVRTRGIMKDTVSKHLESEANARLAPVERLLASTGIACTAEVRLSDQPHDILAVARQQGCKSLIVASKPVTGARRRWLTATGCVGHHLGARLAAISDLPVVILPVGTAQS